MNCGEIVSGFIGAVFDQFDWGEMNGRVDICCGSMIGFKLGLTELTD